MTKCSLKCPLSGLVIVLIAGATASPAYAQYRPMPAPNSASNAQKGENYHVEFSANLWNPTPSFVVASDGIDIQGTRIPGTQINAQADLGIQKTGIYDLRLVLKVAKHHKFRFAYLPLTYASTAKLNAKITFNGRDYLASTDVASDLRWKTYRVGYEYDMVSTRAGFFGVVLEAKITQAQVQLNSAIGNEFAKAQAPIPSIGAIARGYLATGLSVTAEYTYFKLPSKLVKNTDAHYTEYDIYATYNITKNIGAQAGYRKIDIGVTVDNLQAAGVNAAAVQGAAKLKGPYFGAVVRF